MNEEDKWIEIKEDISPLIESKGRLLQAAFPSAVDQKNIGSGNKVPIGCGTSAEVIGLSVGAIGGKIIIPVGGNQKQKMMLIEKTEGNKLIKKEFNDFSFVPLLGKDGWKE